MLSKLFKYEMKSYRFSMGITFLAGLVFTLFMKILCILPYKGEMKEVVQMFTFYGYYYIIMMIAFAAQILIVVQFYKTTVSDRGYLTWTLPVKASSVLWSKILAGGVWYMLSGIVIVLLFFLFITGNYWSGSLEIFGGEILDLFSEIFAEIGVYLEIHYIIPIVLWILACIVWSFSGFMLFYMCIAIGQLFGKWRILASIGTYFVVMFIVYCLSVAFMLITSITGTIAITESDINPFMLFTAIMGGLLLVGIGAFASTFAITNVIFKKRLNLE